MAELPSATEGHLVVAAIRVIDHAAEHPPTEAEIARILHWHEDRVRVVLHGLETLGAVAALKSPFDVRYQLGDHTLLEQLGEAESTGDHISREMEDYDARAKSEQERIERLLGTAPAPNPDEESVDALENEFGEFKQQEPKNPFGDD